NDVHIGQGDEFQFGSDISIGSGGSLGTSIQGLFTPTGSANPTFLTSVSPFNPLTVDANFCATRTPFSLPPTNGSWQVRFTNGTDVAIAQLPSVSIIPSAPVPFPSSVTITANPADPTTPTISWSLPAGTNPNALRVNIFDKSVFLPNGQNDVI